MDYLYYLVPAFLLTLAILVAWLVARRMRSPATATQPLRRKAAERILLTVAAVCLLAVAVCGVYNAIAIHRFRTANPPLGQLYSVHGRWMHLYCIGAGEPTIVLEAGLGASSDVLSWIPLQTKLARYSRVCSYDRAGIGWSEGADTPRDADHIVSDLHALLAEAGVRPPFVFVGLSRGGIYIRDYTAHYRGEVAGLVLIDSSTPYQEQRLHPKRVQDKYPAVRTSHTDIISLALASTSLDAIFMNGMYGNIADKPAACGNAARMLRSGADGLWSAILKAGPSLINCGPPATCLLNHFLPKRSLRPSLGHWAWK